MIAVRISPASASSTSLLTLTWKNINWRKVVVHVRQLQMRIAKAYREGKHNKVKALQWLLSHSISAKLLAVKRVVQNRGAKTPGIDGIVWTTHAQKMQAVLSLKRRGYQTKPLKRIYIPKKQKGKLRPLSIPTMECRAQQALHLLSLEPIAEIKADKNAYGFRPFRSAADAIQQCHNALAQKNSAQYILEGDIRSCFDSISHQWLQSNVPMDKELLRKWLSAGYIERGKLHSTNTGTPQGGIISPTILNVALCGLEQAVKVATKPKDKVNICIYADDFIITGSTREILEDKVRPVVEVFLSERGLSLSQEKTKISSIQEGFDFLGMNVQKHHSRLIIKPAKNSVKRFLANIRRIIKNNVAINTEDLIELLNLKIRGWTNYYRHVCSKKTFYYIDHEIFKALWRWALKRHPNKGKRWIRRKYFRTNVPRNWVFHATLRSKHENRKHVELMSAGKVSIRRHIKIKAAAIPYDPAYHNYFDKRVSNRDSNNPAKLSDWWLCWWRLLKPRDMNDKSRVAQQPYKGLSRVR